MITRKEICTSESLTNLPDHIWKHAVFYDIETTGLGRRSSHVYLIGVLFYESGKWILRQWFLDRPFEEKKMLSDFSAFLQQLDSPFLVDYNGETFDLPYLRGKYAYYRIPLPEPLSPDVSKPFSDKPDSDSLEILPVQKHLDLLRAIRPLKSRLHLSSLRLQSIETLLHTGRTDTSSGKELIDVYCQYLQTCEDTLLEQLFLHNRDDVAALPSVTSLLSFSEFWKGSFQVADKTDFGDRLCFRLENTAAFPVALSLEENDCTLSFDNRDAVLVMPVVSEERKLFFKDYKNYYYLPGEDQAIHKSVGVFTAPQYRENAKAATCYQRVVSRFIPFPSDPGIPGLHSFYREYKDKTAWIRAEDLLSCDPVVLHTCIRCILAGFF